MLRVAVVVVGDIGRSPRMLYHARALAESGATVELIGDVASDLPRFLARAGVTVHPVRTGAAEPPASGRIRYLVAATVRALRLVADLARLLIGRVPRPDVILVQTPPAVPVLAIALLASRLRGARLVIDWHNLTSAMLGLRLGAEHTAVSLVARYERALARRADGHLFVSQTMADALQSAWGISGPVFRDRPAEQFVALEAGERRRSRSELLARLETDLDERAALIVISPTSWTVDEDMDLLAAAAIRADTLLSDTDGGRGDRPAIALVITGRGAMRAPFERRLARMRLARVSIRTAWLGAEAYASTLACADLGVSMHRSASGLDLPMKVLDLFGAGVPVAALDYGPCLRELVREGENGWLFTDADSLAARLVEACLSPEILGPLREGVRRAGVVRWGEAWTRDAAPVIKGTGVPAR